MLHVNASDGIRQIAYCWEGKRKVHHAHVALNPACMYFLQTWDED